MTKKNCTRSGTGSPCNLNGPVFAPRDDIIKACAKIIRGLYTVKIGVISIPECYIKHVIHSCINPQRCWNNTFNAERPRRICNQRQQDSSKKKNFQGPSNTTPLHLRHGVQQSCDCQHDHVRRKSAQAKDTQSQPLFHHLPTFLQSPRSPAPSSKSRRSPPSLFP